MSIQRHLSAEYGLNRFGTAVPTHVPNYVGEPYFRSNGEIWIASTSAAAGWVCRHRFGADTPEAAVTAPVGTLYSRSNGGADTTLYVKESGTGNTGWVAIA
jgi:hypothetical protein